ncbi:MAG: hypothetical protein RSE36_03350 [Oscillospiraceae bacterium]
MLKEFVEKIVSMDEPHIKAIDGRSFSDKKMEPIVELSDCLLSGLNTNTLTSIIDYVANDVDRPHEINEDARYIIHVSDYNRVSLMREANRYRKREPIIETVSNNGTFKFNSFMDIETLIIQLQSSFIMTDNLKNLLSAVSSISDTTEVQQRDDGVTQAVTAKTGVALVSKKDLPNPISLCPYRTFPEVNQPEMQFVFRVRKSKYEGIEAALYEADGERWKLKTISDIKAFFDGILGDSEKVVVLA